MRTESTHAGSWVLCAITSLGFVCLSSCGGKIPVPSPSPAQPKPAASVVNQQPQKKAEAISDIRLSDAPAVSVAQAQAPQTVLDDAVAERLFAALPALPTPRRSPYTFPSHQVAVPSGEPTRLDGLAGTQYPVPKPISSTEPITLLHHSPVGEVWSAPFVTATFSEPMVPVASYDALSRLAPPLVLTPEPAGAWRWIGTRTALFQPKERFAMATAFSVLPRPKATSLNGAPLPATSSWSFATPPPTVVDNWPRLGSSQVGLEPKFFVRFDQNIDPTKVLPFIELRAGGKSQAVRLRTAAEAADDQVPNSRNDAEYEEDDATGVPPIDSESSRQWLALRTEEALPADTDVQLIVKRGAPSAEGPRTTEKDQVMSFKTRGALKLVLAPCGPGNPCIARMGLALLFNNLLDEDAYKPEWLTVTPAVEGWSSTVVNAGNGGRLQVSGKLRDKTQYTLFISDQLRDRFGQTLGKIVKYTFTMSPAQPQLNLEPTPMVVLDPALPPELWMQTINQPEVTAKIFRVSPTDYPAYVKLTEKPGGPPPFGKLVGTEVIVPQGPTDELISTRIDLGKYMTDGTGHVIVYCEGKVAAPNRTGMLGIAAPAKPATAMNWVQGTRIGLLAFAEAQQRRVWTVDLADGKPLAGVRVSPLGSGISALSDLEGLGVLKFVKGQSDTLLAQRNNDIALLPRSDVAQAQYLATRRLRWFVIDSGRLYKPGETVHVKGWLRQLAAEPRADLAVPDFVKQAPLKYSLEVGTGLDERALLGLRGTTRVDAAGEFDFHVTVPKSATPRSYALRMKLVPEHPRATQLEDTLSIRVAEFERPEFELTLQQGPLPLVAGTRTQMSVTAQYLTGGALTAAKTVWLVHSQFAPYAPPNWREYRFSAETHQITDEVPVDPKAHQGHTDRAGRHLVTLDIGPNAVSYPRLLNLSATVSDLNQRAQTKSAQLLLHPATVTVGLKATQTQIEPGKPIGLEVIVTDLDGKVVAGRPVEVKAEFQRTRDLAGEGETVATCRVVSGAVPQHCDLATSSAGYYRVTATVSDAAGRVSRSRLMTMAYGQGWMPGLATDELHAHARLDKPTYQAGDRAELLVVAPFAPAEGVLTVNRAGTAEFRRFSMRDTTIRLPIEVRAEYLPEVFVSVDLVGKTPRRRADGALDATLPPLPAYAHAVTALKVSDVHRRLAVAIQPLKSEVTPGATLPVELNVTDPTGKPATATHVTLMAIDEALLTLVEESSRNMVGWFYLTLSNDVRPQPLYWYLPRLQQQQARTAAAEVIRQSRSGKLSGSRQQEGVGLKTISAVNLAPAVADEPSEEQLPTALRSDFSAVGAFLPHLVTDARGRVHTEIKLPDSVTRYRLLAYAAQGERNFGQAEQLITAKLPLMLRPAAPQFLNQGDQFELAVLVQNPSNTDVPVQLALRAATANIIGPRGYAFTLAAGERQQVRFTAVAPTVGQAVFQVAAASTLGSDAAQVSVPVQVPAVVESFAHYGELKRGTVSQRIELPQNVHADWGGLEVTTAASAVGQLDAPLQSLVESRFDLVDTRVSRILATVSLRKQWQRLHRAGKSLAELDATVRRDLLALAEQRAQERDQWGTPQASAHNWAAVHRAHAVLLAKAEGFAVNEPLLQDVKSRLGRLNPSGKMGKDRWRTLAYAAFVLHSLDAKKALARAELLLSEVGQLNQLPLEAVGWLLPVLSASGAHQRDVTELKRLIDNGFTQSAAEAHLSDVAEHAYQNAEPVVLKALLETDPNHPLITPLAKGLLTSRQANAWQSGQRTALALMSLSRFIELREPANASVTARGWLNGRLAVDRPALDAKAPPVRSLIPWEQLKPLDPSALELRLGKTGTGTLYYRVGLTYAPLEQRAVARDQGFALLRTYEAVDSPADVKRMPDGTWWIQRGARVRVRTYLQTAAQRNYVALTDPLPAGLQFIDTSLGHVQPLPSNDHEYESYDPMINAGPAARARSAQLKRLRELATASWYSHHVARKDRIQAFAGEIAAGTYSFEYTTRAVTPGTFLAPGPEVQELHAPETFGRGDGATIIVQ